MKIPALLITVLCLSGASYSAATNAAPAPDLNLRVTYYNRTTTPEGVTRESRYSETMVRRHNQVWIARVLPSANLNLDEAHDHEHGHAAHSANPVSPDASGTPHKHFNSVLLPRHIRLENNTLRLDYIDAQEKEIIAILPTEYENVDFDGSWANAYYLIDPQLLQSMPRTKKPTPTASAVWHEREKNGIFQRVLWNSRQQIPLAIESGDKAGTFYRRVEVKIQTPRNSTLPWQNLQGYTHKEYSDFLD